MSKPRRTAVHEASHLVCGMALGAIPQFVRIGPDGGDVFFRSLPSDERARRVIYAAGAVGEVYLARAGLLWSLEQDPAWDLDAAQLRTSVAAKYAPGSFQSRLAHAAAFSVAQLLVAEHHGQIANLAELLERCGRIDAADLRINVRPFPVASLPDDPAPFAPIDIAKCERLLADFNTRSSAWYRAARPVRHNQWGGSSMAKPRFESAALGLDHGGAAELQARAFKLAHEIEARVLRGAVPRAAPAAQASLRVLGEFRKHGQVDAAEIETLIQRMQSGGVEMRTGAAV